MQRLAFRMTLLDGRIDEYKRRHDEIWPELTELLHTSGIRDYTIWVDEATGHLFALMHLTDNHQLDRLPEHPVMQKWWAYMADLMETNSDNSPVVVELEPVFHQP